MAAKFVAEEGVLKELVLSLEGGDQWIIGRDPDSCQLLVEDPAVSRKHLLCRKTTEGIVIENLTPSNLTYVNDEQITGPRLLAHGDTIKIGDTTFRYYVDAAAHLFEEPTTQAEMNAPSSVNENKEAQKNDANGVQISEEERHDTIFEDELEGKSSLANVNFDLMDTGRWLLKVIGGPNNGAEFPMQTGHSYIIGTDPNVSDIVFYDTSVSRQHARISITPEDTISIEDLKSRNGTRVEGELLDGSRLLPPNTIVTAGTTSFVVYDREGEMQTIISPLLPSIVKVLQNQPVSQPAAEGIIQPQVGNASVLPVSPSASEAPLVSKPKPQHSLGALLLLATLIGLFVLVGIGVSTLFMQEPIVIEQQIDTEKALSDVFTNFPGLKYSFNKSTGHLLIVGHVLTASDKSQLGYTLQGLHFVKDIDDSGVIIDEYVWKETNQVLSENPNWKGVTVYATTPGHFILSGYLQNRAQGEQVWDYLTRNFPYSELLENKIIVEEDIFTAATNALRASGLNGVAVKMSAGEVSLSGTFPAGKKDVYAQVVAHIKELPGVRAVNSFASEANREEGVINVSNKYTVSGSSKADGGNLNVVINGRILAVGDVLDGMKITSIQPNVIFLEKDDMIYRIDF